MRNNKQNVVPFVLLITGGLLILLGGILTSAFAAFGIFFMRFCPMCAGFLGMSMLAGIVLGAVILYCAFEINAYPRRSKEFATAALVASVLSLLNGGGFFLGFLLSFIGSVFLLAS
ncbi:MAG: DUF6114 domain-containing protein [Candidatus Micrarchaeia archaeon]